jgi:hypothetical protein
MTPIVGGASLLRRARAGDIRKNGTVKKAAFLPSTSGKDRDGLSVSIQDEAFRALHRTLYVLPGRKTAIIRSDLVRVIGLDVHEAPEEQDPKHALIVGIPDLTQGGQQKVLAERCAEQLASMAREYDHDTGEEMAIATVDTIG